MILKIHTQSVSALFQHNLFCDNCHSHVARSLNLMRYEGSASWNMYKLGFWMVFKGKFTGYVRKLLHVHAQMTVHQKYSESQTT